MPTDISISYVLTSNGANKGQKLQIRDNTKLAIMPIFPTL